MEGDSVAIQITCYIRSFWGKVFETDEMTRYKAINKEQPVKEV